MKTNNIGGAVRHANVILQGLKNSMNYKGNGFNYYTERIGEKWFYYELYY